MRKYLNVQPVLPSFLSEKDDLVVHEWIPVGTESGVHRRGPDMVEMARWSMHYLIHNPQRPRGCECRFNISLLDCPPARADDEHDPIAVGDTESRMELEFVYMREMTAMVEGRDVENAIRSRLNTYVRADGLCWCSPRALGTNDTEPAAMPWTTGYLLRSTAERYLHTHDERDQKMCRRLVDGLKSLASARDDLLWYEGGLAAWRDGVWQSACQDHYPSIIDALIRYWEISGEQDVLRFAEAMADGIVQGVQKNLGGSRIQPDGSHCTTNCHLVMRPVMGVAQVGAATGNARYIEWARRTYEFTRAHGTDWGWYPENLVAPFEYQSWSETCVTADMVECAVALARARFSEYWDHVERAVRNYLAEAQFFLTPEFVKLYRRTHESHPDDCERGLTLMRKFEGGFIARQRPNDWVYHYEGKNQINMMGCCPPSGMHALYLAWANTIIERDGRVFVNMALDRDSEAARVTTHAPQSGRIDVEVRKSAEFHLRPPSWTQRDQVRVWWNDKQIAPEWHSDYVKFADAKAGDQLRLEYPLPRFSQRVPIGHDSSMEMFEARWIGNDVEEVSPRGRIIPIFDDSRFTRSTPSLSLNEKI